MFNYYHYRVGNEMNPKHRCDFWSLAIILLEIISMRSHKPHYRMELRLCKTVEEVKNWADDFIKEIEENRFFLEDDLLSKIQGYLDV